MNSRPLIVITGSSGLIGSRAVVDLARDHRVACLDVEAPDELPENATFHYCDMTNDVSVHTALERVAETEGRHITSVIHLAAYYDFSGEPSTLYQELTVEGTRRLLRELKNFTVEQFIFTSTILVMKEAEIGEIIDETSPLEGEWDYPRSKIEAETVIAREHGDIPVVVLRLAGVYDEQGHSPPISQQIWRIYERRLESHLFPGDQEHGQPFVHLDDAVLALRKAVERRAALGDYEVFLIAEPDMMSYSELQERLGELIHGEDEWTTLRIPIPLAKVGAWARDKLTPDEDAFIQPWMIDLADAHFPVSSARAERKLGWLPRHSLSETLEDMVNLLRTNPRQFYTENALPT